MRKPSRPLTLALLLPFVGGCFGVAQSPLPPPVERAETQLRGVVVRADDGGEDQWVRLRDILNVEWREGSLFVVASVASGAPPMSHEWAYEDLSGILTREMDVNRTSLLVSGVIVSVVTIIAALMTGQTNSGTIIQG